jgi:hypothetical protein
MDFDSEQDAIDWALQDQFGKRTLSSAQRIKIFAKNVF